MSTAAPGTPVLLFTGGVWCQQLHLAHLYFCLLAFVWCQQLHLAHLYLCLLLVFGVNSCTWHTCTFVYWWCLVSTAAPVLLFTGGVWCQQLHLAHLYFCLLVVFGVNSCTWHTCTFVYWRCLVSTAAPGTPVLLGVTRDAAQPAGGTSVLPAGGSTGRLRLHVQPGPYGLLGETLLLLALCTPSPFPTCSWWNHRVRGLLVQPGLMDFLVRCC